MATLIEIKIFPSKGSEETVDKVRLFAGGGLEGDRHSADTTRAISLVDCDAIRIAKERDVPGFCGRKFSANFTTSGVDYLALRPGSEIQIGDVRVKIDSIGKRCFPDCPVVDKAGCPLHTHVAFGVAINDGFVQTGDTICPHTDTFF